MIRGPRQVGKSSLLIHLDRNFLELSLDDPALRSLAQRDPDLFLSQHEGKALVIDEVQYAPALFPSLKRKVDLWKRQGDYSIKIRITGSNQISLDQNVRESLAGRATIDELCTLSVAEIIKVRSLGLDQLIYLGGWPEIHARELPDSRQYLDQYINTFIEKDIVISAGITKVDRFIELTRHLAARTGQFLNTSELGRDIGVESNTIKSWVQSLERMGIISLLSPYSTNATSRMVKAPKIFFLDTGLACRLQGFASPNLLLSSPQAGSLFECLVFAEVYKTIRNFDLPWQMYTYRTRDGDELDFLIVQEGKIIAQIESKMTLPLANISAPKSLKSLAGPSVPLWVVHGAGDHVLEQGTPIQKLRDRLLGLWDSLQSKASTIKA